MLNPLTIHADSSERLHYNLDDFPLYTHKDELYRYGYSAVCHWHPDLEFIYIKKGTMDFFVNGKTVRMDEGDGIFVNSQRLHYGFSKEQNDCTFIALVISPEIFIHSSHAGEEYMNKKFGLKNTDYIPLYKHVSWQKEILDLIQYIHQLINEKALRPLRLLSKAIEILDLIGAHIEDYKENNYDSREQFSFLKMTTFIIENFQNKIDLADIAKAGAVNRNKCCELFKKFTRSTPNDYLTNYRISRSIEYLRDTHLSIIEISLMCGFNTPSYYTNVFKKNKGTTPKEYRKNFTTN